MIPDNWARYRRQLEIPGWTSENQSRLSHARVGVIGAGGLGCAVLPYLASAGIGRLTIVDRDCVDITNLNRQTFYSEKDLGQPKVFIAKQQLNRINPMVEVIALHDTVDDSLAEKIFPDQDLLISCVDNYDTRFTITQTAHRYAKAVVHGAVSGFRGEAGLFHSVTGPCYLCLYPSKPDVTDSGVFGAIAGFTGSLMALLAIRFFTGMGQGQDHTFYIFDFEIQDMFRMAIRKNPDCPVCNSEM